MKTVRFSKVIEGAGDPETYLVLADPADDKQFQAAVKAERVMTVFQTAVGNKTDRGEVGFNPGKARQFLVFPKSLKRFKGKSVVGIKYDLITTPELSESERAAPVRPPKRTQAKKKPAKPAAKPPGPKKEAPAKKKPAKSSRTKARKKASNIVQFPSSEDGAGDKSGSVAALKSQVRRAMKLLEQGKQVAAFSQLQRILGS